MHNPYFVSVASLTSPLSPSFGVVVLRLSPAHLLSPSRPSAGAVATPQPAPPRYGSLCVASAVAMVRKPSKGVSSIRPHLLELAPYTPVEPLEVMEARGRKEFPNIYPDPESRRLRAALAEQSGLGAEHSLVGCGADELIDFIYYEGYCAIGRDAKRDGTTPFRDFTIGSDFERADPPIFHDNPSTDLAASIDLTRPDSPC